MAIRHRQKAIENAREWADSAQDLMEDGQIQSALVAVKMAKMWSMMADLEEKVADQ